MGMLLLAARAVSAPVPANTTPASPGGATRSTPLESRAAAIQAQLANRILPYWFDTTIDRTHGGYLLADDGRGGHGARDKQLVGQARLLWTFSMVHRQGYSTGRRNYLAAAGQGYRFLIEHFLDPEDGGYFWRTDLSGRPTAERKILYGQSFVIYALVEYHRASGDPEPLRRALELHAVLQRHAHDRRHDGWMEHFERDWKPIVDPKAPIEVEVAGLKSANAHLHWMEALTELFEASRDRAVRRSLEEALRLNRHMFYPSTPGKSAFHRQPDWSPVNTPGSAGLSYGHNVEFAWLMVRAQQVLGARPAWEHFEAHLDHALRHGADHERGGLYNRGIGDLPATQTDKVWWVQAEWIAALSDALRRQPNAGYEQALIRTLDFVDRHLADPADGIWADTVTADGQPKSPAKAHAWKANYHDVRALVKFVEAFPAR
jgi:mannobiose 2-epimerase